MSEPALGSTSWKTWADSVDTAALRGGNLSVGQTKVDVYNGYGGDLVAAYTAMGDGKAYYLGATSATLGTAGLVIAGNNTHIVGDGVASQLTYHGTGIAIDCGSKTSGTTVTGVRLRDFRVTDSAGTGTVGVRLVGVQDSRSYGLRIDGFGTTGAIGLLLDTQSVGSFITSAQNRFHDLLISNCANGVKITQDPARAGTDGCNWNMFFGTRVTGFTGTGIDVDAGEANMFFGTDASAVANGTTGVRINDDVTKFYGLRADNSFGGGNTAVGIHLTANARDHKIYGYVGNGPTTPIVRDTPSVPGRVEGTSSMGVSTEIFAVRRSLVAPGGGSDWAYTRALLNTAVSTVNATEIAYIDTTTAGAVKRCDTTAGRRHLWVCTEPAASGGLGQFAELGTVPVKCDAGAVVVGDTLVQSTVTNACAMSNNTVTDPALIVGVAWTAKAAGAAGSTGTVQASIR